MLILLYTLIVTHITIICVTVFLLRGQAHRGLTFSPVLEHFMRFWLWMTTGMVTKQWVAIHRRHHQHSDQPGDPHSPHVFGIWNIFLRGVYYYYAAAKDARMTVTYGKGTPDDWMERNVYTPHNYLGVMLMLAIDVALFGGWGFLVWAVQMVWIPFWAAGVVNGIGHWWGYRNAETRDHSRNVVPWDFWVGGELLHGNHHLNPASPKLSLKWWEFDIGWMYIQIFRALGLVKLTR